MKNIEKINEKLKKELPNFHEPFEYTEIGDGNVNYVYRVKDKNGVSYIIKYAANHIRGNVNRKLSVERNEIEFIILKKQSELSKGKVPKVYFRDDELRIFVMEDLKDYKILWNELSEYKIFKSLDENISSFLYETLFKTTDLCMNPNDKKKLAKMLTNIDMCEISERLVFTEPIFDSERLNSFCTINRDFVERKVYSNQKLLFNIAKLKDNFKNRSEAMLHGDLHTGSIFIKDNLIKVFDPEFSFYGPIGYDIGNIVANLIINYVVANFETKENNEYVNWLNLTIKGIFNKFIEKYNSNYYKDVTEVTSRNEDFKLYYLDKILKDSIGYMGCEILRRTIGMAKVPQLKSIDNVDILAMIERILIWFSVGSIENHENVYNITKLIDELDERIKYEKK